MKNLLTPIYELEAQTAPYGMEFYTGDQFPENYEQRFIYRSSWNRRRIRTSGI